MKYAVFLLSLFLFFVIGVHVIHAQNASINGNLNDLSVSFYPENPQANQEVTMKINSYLVDLDSADISWSIDGKKIQSGVGLTTFKFTTKNIGIQTKIDLIVLPVGGTPIERNMVVTPSSLDILWEATDSATPPFYKGKALPTSEAKLKFVAIPNIKGSNDSIVNPKDLIYNWTNDFEPVKSVSGYGRDSYSMQMQIADTGEKVGVTATMRGGGLSAAGDVATSVYDPKVVWYITSPLYGPQFERAITDGFNVKSNDISIFAEPFFASPANILSNVLSYVWSLNGSNLDAQSPANVLFLHRDSQNTGTAVIDLSIESSEKYLQEIKSTLNLNLQ